MSRPSLRRHISQTAGLIVALATLAMIALMVITARKVDGEARRSQAEAVAAGLRHYAADQTEKAIPQAYWDEAVKNLDQRFDLDWTRRFIGEYLLTTAQIDVAAVADATDSIRFFMLGGKEVAPPQERSLVAAATPLFGALRAAERARGARTGPAPLRPITARRFARVDGQLVFLSAILVQPDGSARLSGARAPVVLTGKIVDARELGAIAARHGLEQARLVWGALPATAHRNRVILGEVEQPLATLEWKAERPGQAIVRTMLPLVLLFAIGLAAMGMAGIDRAARLARHLERSERRARKMSRSDALTGLANRTEFDRIAGKHIAAGGPLAIFCIDLDHFKLVNDTLGHQAGDELLRRAAAVLRRSCISGECVGRIGGDEFALCLHPADRAGAARVAERVIEAMALPIDLKDGRVFIGASIGITLIDGDDVGAEEALRRADLALYQAKAQGRARFAFYEPALDEAVQARQQLQQQLHAALDAQSLRLFYQPQVDLDGRIVAAEALLRWSEREAEPVAISALIGLAEETGLIERLGHFTLERAFAESARLGDLSLAINVSAIQLRLPDFVETVDRLAAAHRVDLSRIELELTESALLEDEPDLVARMEALRARGLSLVLDDFGTGFCGLGYLRRFPIDKVKIDRSFIAELGRDEQAEAMVAAVVRLARALGIQVVAEGVETADQRRRLAAAGCPVVQGFFTGRPQPLDELAERLRAAGTADCA